MNEIPPSTFDEQSFWKNSREILIFVGICGAGKTTLAAQLADRCKMFGGNAIGTLDWDPHTSDLDRHSERAFNREFDRIISEGSDPEIFEKIVAHSLELISAWKSSDANLIVVDRWYESYDNFPQECATQIQEALAKSGFTIRTVFLTVAMDENGEGDLAALCDRVILTKQNRPSTWWTDSMGTVEQFAQSEMDYQRDYLDFLQTQPFPLIVVPTEDLKWKRIENEIMTGIVRSEA